jgi:hypothetical protein
VAVVVSDTGICNSPRLVSNFTFSVLKVNEKRKRKERVGILVSRYVRVPRVPSQSHDKVDCGGVLVSPPQLTQVPKNWPLSK